MELGWCVRLTTLQASAVWGPQHLGIPQASMDCYGDSFTYIFICRERGRWECIVYLMTLVAAQSMQCRMVWCFLNQVRNEYAKRLQLGRELQTHSIHFDTENWSVVCNRNMNSTSHDRKHNLNILLLLLLLLLFGAKSAIKSPDEAGLHQTWPE
jgi:hypothetical protein